MTHLMTKAKTKILPEMMFEESSVVFIFLIPPSKCATELHTHTETHTHGRRHTYSHSNDYIKTYIIVLSFCFFSTIYIVKHLIKVLLIYHMETDVTGGLII